MVNGPSSRRMWTPARAELRAERRGARRPHVQQQRQLASTRPTPPYQSLGVGQQTVITVPYTVTDNTGATSTAKSGHHRYRHQRRAGVANANTVAATEDTALTIAPATLLGNDTDIDNGTTLSITSVQGAVNGTVALVGGNVVFTPAATTTARRRSPTPSRDGNGGTSTATVTVNVAAVNDAPVAQANFTVAEDAAVVNGAVTATDGRQHVELCAQRRGGRPHVQQQRLQLQPRERCVPVSVWAGHRHHRALHGNGTTQFNSPPANLVITVTGTNDAPVARAANFTGRRGCGRGQQLGHRDGCGPPARPLAFPALNSCCACRSHVQL